MGKQYKSVGDMVRGLSEDEKFKNEALNELQNRGIARLLFVLRCNNKLTQKAMAEKIGCSQARVSKIEASKDEELSIKDLEDYGKALSLKLTIGYREKNIKYVDMVKYHAFEIRRYLQLLSDLSKEDEQITDGVADFHFEALINISKIIFDGVMNLKKNTRLKINRVSIKETPNTVQISGSPIARVSSHIARPGDAF